MVQPAQRMPSAAAVCASPSVRDGLAYPNSEPPPFKNVGDLLPVGIADDEGPRVGLVDGPGRREAALMRSAGRQRPGARSPKISAQKRWIPSPGETRPGDDRRGYFRGGAVYGLFVLSGAAAPAYRPHSSSASRATAGAAGFLTFSQRSVRPERYGEPRRFDTMPSQPRAQACLKMIAPSPV